MGKPLGAELCMPRDADDDLETHRALDDWLSKRPDAAIVVAAVDEAEPTN